MSAFEAEHMIYLLLKLRIMIADNVGKGDLCDRTHNSRAAKKSSEKILKAAKSILNNPAIGKTLDGRNDRELFTSFGKNSYIFRYQIIDQKVVILKIWHAREDR
ncbi:type II toxin-antitoxin system RelE/ParE family toxin [Bathymodiolus japonicus methanotrophic gill symbiont]|uniref:type II toxin-antitoxin system RelE/ParE family toxin n=1 Tax=Bathymodiolus japonicus methanotrophic gill symbiont TaxID=113269 RepID=UPI001E355958|nr:type II toxin-antitoxin system RelE/ParE family toxin [Bathymodiolus japonicus methanotrophic gill symbiont]